MPGGALGKAPANLSRATMLFPKVLAESLTDILPILFLSFVPDFCLYQVQHIKKPPGTCCASSDGPGFE